MVVISKLGLKRSVYLREEEIMTDSVPFGIVRDGQTDTQGALGLRRPNSYDGMQCGPSQEETEILQGQVP